VALTFIIVTVVSYAAPGGRVEKGLIILEALVFVVRVKG
jgi:hypothetical protein